jgi:uncharacterized membrane protein
VDFQADRAAQVLVDPDVVVVVSIVAVHGAPVPWGKVVMNGVPVVAATAQDGPRVGVARFPTVVTERSLGSTAR